MTGQVEVVNGAVKLSESETEDVSATLAGGPFLADGETSALYAGFRLRFSQLPGGEGTYFAHFKGAGTVYRGRVWALTNGAASGHYRLGISSISGFSVSAIHPAELRLHQEYRVVCRLGITNAAATLWIEPRAESEPAVTTTETEAGAALAAFALRQAGGAGELTVDDLTVATRFAEVVPPARKAILKVMTYNVSGNGALDWSTNTAQVQAIGRQVRCLEPDIVSFNEIPQEQTWQMTNFSALYLAGYYLATNSGTDGYLRSVIASRYPIARSTSWLNRAGLAPFGYTNTTPYFTRDLFEAEVAVPGYCQPLHLFAVHFKAGRYTNELARRAAEASAVSNHLATVFRPEFGHRPYLLLGDLNEDVRRPPPGTEQPVERLLNPATGLDLLTPLNSASHDDCTVSIRTGLTARYDYILPGSLLASNVAASEVFRSDIAQPLPPGLLAGDSATASDHLPVLAVFRNPYAVEFTLQLSLGNDGRVRLDWSALPGCAYVVAASLDLRQWAFASALLNAAADGHLAWTNNSAPAARFFRVYRCP